MILNGAGDRVRTGDVQLGKLGDVLVLAGDLGEARRDVIVSLAKLGQLTGEREYWQQALAVATALEAEGRLAPRDQWMLGDLAERAGGGAGGGS